MSSDDENGASPSLMSLSKRTKRGRLVQMPQSHRPEGAPPLQRRAHSPVIIHSTPKRVRRKVRSEEDELADLASAFKRQRQSAPATDVAPDAFGSSTEMTPGTETPEQESTPSPTSEHNGPNFDDRESQGLRTTMELSTPSSEALMILRLKDIPQKVPRASTKTRPAMMTP
ncbi:uncharacterized protein ARMOST_21979 [Armillaria ostoyae]|uniref:Uncharacterized protein n=1 Tax=Armillaria ostoyae TaxID=47428 RepID=A0A284SBK3_ARMOS|nr:uncharacterized protein ARMOST_21979 [Armillaria ostoyae]